MYNRISIAAILFLSIILMSSTCERPVEIELAQPEPRLVINSAFTAGEFVKVNITQTQSIFESSEVTFIENAKVEVFHEGQLLEELTYIPQTNRAPPSYVSQEFRPLEGETYILKAYAPGFEAVTAESYVPMQVRITQLGISNVQVVENPELENDIIYNYNVNLEFEDPADEVNYYHLDFFQEVFNFYLLEGDTIIVSKEKRKIDFSPANDNNFFIAYFDGGVLFEDQIFNGNLISYSFNLQTRINSSNQLIGLMFAQLRTVSEDYYKFYNSVSRQQDKANDPFSPPVIIDGNITNGNGVFAGYSQTVDSIFVIN